MHKIIPQIVSAFVEVASGIEYRNKTDMLISNRCLSLNPDVYQTSF